MRCKVGFPKYPASTVGTNALLTMSKNLIRHMNPALAPEELRSNAKEIIIHSPAMAEGDVAGYFGDPTLHRIVGRW